MQPYRLKSEPEDDDGKTKPAPFLDRLDRVLQWLWPGILLGIGVSAFWWFWELYDSVVQVVLWLYSLV